MRPYIDWATRTSDKVNVVVILIFGLSLKGESYEEFNNRWLEAVIFILKIVGLRVQKDESSA